MEKIWKSIKGFNGYKISNYGEVYSEKTKKQLSLIKSKDGYLTTTLYLNGKGYKFYIHRLVAINFIKNNNKKFNQVNHIDGNKENNFVGNLEWVDSARNQIHAYKNGLKSCESVKKANSKKVECIETGEIFDSITQASKKLKINRNNISNSCHGNTRNTNGLHFRFI